MKKIIAILLVALMATTTMILTACNNTVISQMAVRWEDYEQLTYDISLLAKDESALTKEEDDIKFYNNLQLVNFDTTDKAIPTNVTGTYTTTMELDGDNYVFSTELNVKETYTSGNYYVTKLLQNLTNEQRASIVDSETDTEIVLANSTKTSVTFKADDNKQTTVSSSKEVLGYYIGKANQELSNYSYTCSYEGNEATTKLTNNGETTTTKTTIEGNYIDAAQLTIYARSFEQNSAVTSAQSVVVFAPETQSVATANFTLSYSYYSLLHLDGVDNVPVVTSAISVVLNSEITNTNYYAFALYNNPKDYMVSSSSAGGKINKYTTMKLQSDLYVMELSSYTDSQKEDLKYVKPVEEDK